MEEKSIELPTSDEAGKKAESLFRDGYNCAQAVLCAFAPSLGLDEETAKGVALAFGGGMARTRNVCGAVSGSLMACGLYMAKMQNSGTGSSGKVAKDDCYKVAQKIMEEFRKENGSIICGELLGMSKAAASSHDTSATSSERTESYYKKRPCPEICRVAAQIVVASLS